MGVCECARLFPDLTANDMMLYFVRGINLPPPSGVSPGDLDACVKFEFPFPSAVRHTH